ncbi:YtxH domain-containing protein [Paenibacillus piri]|uniref:YtxH domain-containing protein n=1 Tax=Paenibacillus piri TaxID=2547395 RepID=A0A4R5KKY7_9BACL|nr:YtxH domain-containing protein [Paenibacillus piri]TDF95508.1 YtxH domain-containing protein [Paenibacillus piri]
MEAAETKRNDLLIGTIVGGAAGALIALLLAPKAGRELREDLIDTFQSIRSKGQEWLEQAASKTADTVQYAAEQGTELLDKAHQATDQAASAARSATDTAAEATHRAVQAAERTVDRAADRTHEAIEEVKSARPFDRT